MSPYNPPQAQQSAHILAHNHGHASTNNYPPRSFLQRAKPRLARLRPSPPATPPSRSATAAEFPISTPQHLSIFTRTLSSNSTALTTSGQASNSASSALQKRVSTDSIVGRPTGTEAALDSWDVDAMAKVEEVRGVCRPEMVRQGYADGEEVMGKGVYAAEFAVVRVDGSVKAEAWTSMESVGSGCGGVLCRSVHKDEEDDEEDTKKEEPLKATDELHETCQYALPGCNCTNSTDSDSDSKIDVASEYGPHDADLEDWDDMWDEACARVHGVEVRAWLEAGGWERCGYVDVVGVGLGWGGEGPEKDGEDGEWDEVGDKEEQAEKVEKDVGGGGRW